jgi:hypothetical protein
MGGHGAFEQVRAVPALAGGGAAAANLGAMGSTERAARTKRGIGLGPRALDAHVQCQSVENVRTQALSG